MAIYISGAAGRLVYHPIGLRAMRNFDLREGEWVVAKASLFIEPNTADEEKRKESTAHYKIRHISDKVFLVDRYIYDLKTGSYVKSFATSFMKKDYMLGDVNRLRSEDATRPV